MPLAESVYEAVTTGPLKDRSNARYLLGSSLQILYGVYTLLENNEEVMRVEKLFPPGVPIPTIRVRPEPKPKP